MIAHVAGAPLEEALLPLMGAGGMGAGLLVVRAWVRSHVRRPKRRPLAGEETR